MKGLPKKSAMAGVGGAIAIVVAWGIEAFANVSVPMEVAVAMGSVASFALAFLTDRE